MLNRHRRFWLLAVGIMMLGSSIASGQNYPGKPIRIVTAQVGGSQDFGSRLIAPDLGSALGQPIIVENRSGGTIGGEIFSRANPDGYTLMYLPTVAAPGVPGYESTQKAGLFAPAKTPAPIITRLNREVVVLLQRSDMKEKFFSDGVETVGTSPQELGAMVKSEIARIGKIIKDVGIKDTE